MTDSSEAARQRLLGNAATGTVQIRDFDVGMMRSVAGPYTLVEVTEASKSNPPVGIYIQGIPGACPADGLPGIPVVFADPEDTNVTTKYPMILIRRDDLSPAMERWQPAGVQYRAPGPGGIPFVATSATGNQVKGYDRVEQLAQAIPYDITYTVSVKARFRGSTQRNNANALFMHVMRMFPPYGKINVTDSVGDLRGYEAFTDSVSNIDIVEDIQNRILGYALTVRVEAELDLKDPVQVRTVQTRKVTIL